jgi:hypothetical protein
MADASRRRIYGVDFSGAKDAGRRIWIARGTVDGHALRIDECRRADRYLDCGKSRERCLAALRDFIGEEGTCAFGLDFPFGLPRELVKQKNWEDFVLSFPDDYASLEEFGRLCREAGGGRELKRVTDRKCETPFSPYNLRLFRQTYYGIRDVLNPLVRDRLACVLPMQDARSNGAWVLEICPASTLKQEGLYLPYKGRAVQYRSARMHILKTLEHTRGIIIPKAVTRSAILENHSGDALDSIVAALAVFRALLNPAFPVIGSDDAYTLEGYVYVNLHCLAISSG